MFIFLMFYLLSLRYLHLPSKLPAHMIDLGQYLNPISLLFEMTMMNIWRTTCFPALVAYIRYPPKRSTSWCWSFVVYQYVILCVLAVENNPSPL